MARQFIAASSQFLELGSAVLTAPPITMACWFKVRGALATQKLVALQTDGSDNQRFTLGVVSSGAIEATAKTTTVATAATTNVFSTSPSPWHHCCGTFTSNTSRAAYLDGDITNKGTNTTNKSPNAPNRTSIGRADSATPAYFDGIIAEVGLWNVTLEDGEIRSLALGTRPIFIRPMSLVAYWPINKSFSTEIDVLHNPINNMLVTGAIPVLAKPPLRNSFSRVRRSRLFPVAAVAAVLTKPMFPAPPYY